MLPSYVIELIAVCALAVPASSLWRPLGCDIGWYLFACKRRLKNY
jgi:hypothetical protein